MSDVDWQVAHSLPWRIVLHALVAAAVLVPWMRLSRLPRGRTHRLVLVLLVLAPLVTASLPGRLSPEFRGERAWFDSERVLALPLGGRFSVAGAVLVVATLAGLASLIQELLPALRRRREPHQTLPADALRRLGERLLLAVPAELLPLEPGVRVSTSGWPWRPRLRISPGALALPDDQLEVVVDHELAHLRERRWLATHALYVARMLQLFNPVALWAFREYLVDVEIDCDREAAARSGSQPLARALLAAYESTRAGDLAGRGILRLRVDLLLAGEMPPDRHLATALLAGVLLIGLLPWVV